MPTRTMPPPPWLYAAHAHHDMRDLDHLNYRRTLPAGPNALAEASAPARRVACSLPLDIRQAARYLNGILWRGCGGAQRRSALPLAASLRPAAAPPAQLAGVHAPGRDGG